MMTCAPEDVVMLILTTPAPPSYVELDAVMHSQCSEKCWPMRGMRSHLLFNFFGLWFDLGAEAVNCLCKPFTNAGHILRCKTVQVLKEQLAGCALANFLGQHLAYETCDGVEHCVVPAKIETP